MTNPTLSIDGGRVCLDLATRHLSVAGEPARLGGRAFDVLVALVERRDRVVSKQELLDLVWPGLFVEENNLQVHVMALRKLLGTQAIATVSGRGYRWTLAVDSANAALSGEPSTEVGIGASLVGRGALLAEVRAHLDDAAVRLLTLTGTGGSGKTSVALAAARAIRAEPVDGVFVVMLASVRDAALFGPAITNAIGLGDADDAPPMARAVAWLRSRRALLVLDNFEHLPEAAPQVAELLRECPRLKVLVTSRLPLRLREEREIKVPPLALPDSAAAAEVLRASPAVQLFAQRAAAVGRDVLASPADLQAAATICRRVDGLPLAIELAASRLLTFTPVALASRLEQRLPLLTGGAADSPRRHRALRDTIAWSHDLLDEPTRVLFRRLGVFVGGWSLRAAESVDADPHGTWRRLEQLLEHNLVQRLDDVDDVARFAMLETIREFALDALMEAGEFDHCARLHARQVVVGVAELELAFRSGDRHRALGLYRVERGNVNAALHWSFGAGGDDPLRGDLVANLSECWYFDNDSRSGETWFGRLNLDSLAPGLRARVLLVGARIANNLNRFSVAIERARAAESLALESGDLRTRAQALRQIGMAEPDLDAAIGYLQRGFEGLLALGDLRQAALAQWPIGKRMAQEGDRDAEAESILREARARLLALGDRWAAGVVLIHLATLAARRGDTDQATRDATEGSAIAGEYEDTFSYANARHLLARLDAAAGRTAAAVRQERKIVRLLVGEGMERIAAMHCRWLAHLHAVRGEHDTAVRCFAASSGAFGDERFLSLATVTVEDRAEWLASDESLRALLPADRHGKLWREALPWTIEQAASCSEETLANR